MRNSHFLPIVAVLLSQHVIPPAQAAPPVNDSLTGAMTITALPYTHQQDTQAATFEAGEVRPSCTTNAQASVWYQYTPTTDQVLVLDTLGSEYDTALSVWRGKPQSLTEQACNNDNFPWMPQSQVILKLTANFPYFISISAVNGAGGNLVFNAVTLTTPMNDNFASATVISSLPFHHSQYTQGATLETDEKDASCIGVSRASVWYEYTPTRVQEIVLDTNGSDYATVLSVWTGTTLPLAEEACDSFLPQVKMTLTAGTSYYFRVSGINDSVGTLVLNAQEFSPPENDNLADALVIDSLPYHHTQSTHGATAETGEIMAPCGNSRDSVWYQYTPSHDQVLLLDTTGSDYSPVLSVWTGTTQSLGVVDCGTSSQLASKLTANATYYLNVSGRHGGNLVLTAQEIPPLPNDDLASATVITTLPYHTVQSTLEATQQEGETTTSCGHVDANSVWYQYTPSQNQMLWFDTDGSDYDTVLSLWTGTTMPLEKVVCSGSPLSVTLAANTTYYLNVSGYNGAISDYNGGGARGNLVLTAQEATPPPNDDLASATVISTLPYHTVQSTLEATQQEGETTASCGHVDANSVWYQYTPSQNQVLWFDTDGSDYDTVLSLWTGTTMPLEEVVCSDARQLSVTLTANTTYYLNVSGYNGAISPYNGGGARGNLVLTAQEVTPPPNDDPASATIITTLPYHNVQSTLGVAVWYQYTPSQDQVVVFDTAGSDYSGTVSVLIEVGTAGMFFGPFPVLETLAEGTHQLVFKLTANATYYIVVSGEGSAKSNLVLTLQETTLPPNDDFAFATVITTLPYSNMQSTLGATLQGGETIYGVGSVWYQYTPSHDQIVLFDTSGSDYDTGLSVWTGTTLPLKWQEGNGGDDPQLVSKLTANTTYYLKVSGNGMYPYDDMKENLRGNLVLTVQETSLPPNDDLASATVITLPYHTVQSTLGATQQEGETSASCASGGANSVWYQYTPSHDQVLLFDTTGSDYSPILSAWTGTTFPLGEIACRGTYTYHSLVFKVTANTTYYVNVSGQGGLDAGNLVLTAQEVIPPPNDDLASATVIPTLPYYQAQWTLGATLQDGEVVASCAYNHANSVWYQYTPTQDELLFLDTEHSNYGVVLSVWTGTTHPLTELACNNIFEGSSSAHISLRVTAHTTYYINLSDGHSGSLGGNLVLNAQKQVLPTLGQGYATDKTGKTVETYSEFSGGISVNGRYYQVQTTLTTSDAVEILGQIQVDAQQVGQTAEIIVYAAFTPSEASEEVLYYYMLGANHDVLSWDDDPGHLVAMEQVTLSAQQTVQIYTGHLTLPGMLRIVFGYRLPDGTQVTNEKNLEVTVTE